MVACVAIILLTHCPLHCLVGSSAETLANLRGSYRSTSKGNQRWNCDGGGILMLIPISRILLGPTPKQRSATNTAARPSSVVLYAPRSPPAIDNDRNSLDVKLAAARRYRKTSPARKERPDRQASHARASLCRRRLEMLLKRKETDVEPSESHNRMLAESLASVCSGANSPLCVDTGHIEAGTVGLVTAWPCVREEQGLW